MLFMLYIYKKKADSVLWKSLYNRPLTFHTSATHVGVCSSTCRPQKPLCVGAYIKSFLFATVELNFLHLLINADKHHLPENIIDSFTRLFRFRLYLLGLCFSTICLFPSVTSGREMNRQMDIAWTRLFVKDHICSCFHTAAPPNLIRPAWENHYRKHSKTFTLFFSLKREEKSQMRNFDCLSNTEIKWYQIFSLSLPLLRCFSEKHPLSHTCLLWKLASTTEKKHR